MNRRRLVLLSIALCMPLTLPASSVRADAAAAGAQQSLGSLQDVRSHTRDEFVHGMAQMTLAVLQDPKKPYAERKVLLRQCFNTVVDIDWIAKFVLGRAWTLASDDQRKRYMDLYRTFLTESYVSNFAENPDKRIKDIKILGVQDAPENAFIVSTNMLLADREEVRVDYRVSDHDGKYKVIDIVIEDVSLLATHRSQFGELAASKGVEGVIAKLQEINQNRLEDPINISMR